jgi:hypothetical protein
MAHECAPSYDVMTYVLLHGCLLTKMPEKATFKSPARLARGKALDCSAADSTR